MIPCPFACPNAGRICAGSAVCRMSGPELDPEYVLHCAVMLCASQQACEALVATSGPPPWPRIHRCFHCGDRTAQAPQRVERAGRVFDVPSVCSKDECGQASTDPSLYTT